MLGTSCLALYPLVFNARADNYTTTYTLVTNSNPGAGVVCPKNYEVANAILAGSVGNICIGDGGGQRYSSEFDCPAVCVYDQARLQDPRCQGLGTERETQSCNTRIPRATDDVDFDSEDPEAYCFGCQLQLDAVRLKSLPRAYIWIWCVGFVLAYSVWLVFLEGTQARIAEELNSRNITAADYAVWVSNVGGSAGDNCRLVEYARHYGQVVMAFHILSVGKALTKCNQITRGELLLEELRLLKGAPRVSAPLPAVCGLCTGFWFWLYKRYLCGLRSAAAAHKHQAAKLADWKRELEGIEQEGLRPTGNAIIVFNFERHCQNMKEDHQRVHRAGPLRLVFSSDLVRTFHLWTGGRFSRSPRLPLDVGGREQPRFIIAGRAPEPSDVWWENAISNSTNVSLRRIGTLTVYVLLLAASAYLQFLITRRAEAERAARIISSRQLPAEGDASALDTLVTTTSLRGFSVLQGLVVLVLDFIVSLLIDVTSHMELHTSTTTHIAALVTKLTLFYLVNGFIVPIVAVVTLDGSAKLWYTRGGIIETAFYIQIFNGFLPDLVVLLNPSRLINTAVFSYLAKSQPFMDSTLEPQPFSLPIRYASATKTIGLAILYAPVLPISPVIGLFSMAFSYATDTYLALHQSIKPKNFDLGALAFANRIIRAFPLMLLLLVSFLYFVGDWAAVRAPFAIGMAIFLLFLLAPVKSMFRFVRERDTEEGGTADLNFLETFAKLDLQTTAISHQARLGSLNTLAAVPDLASGQRIIPDIFCPSVPTLCSEQWRQEATRGISLIRPPVKPNPVLMPLQKPRTGGPVATEPPPSATATVNVQALAAGGRIMSVCLGESEPASAAQGLEGVRVPVSAHYAAPSLEDAVRLQQPGFYPSPFSAAPAALSHQGPVQGGPWSGLYPPLPGAVAPADQRLPHIAYPEPPLPPRAESYASATVGYPLASPGRYPEARVPGPAAPSATYPEPAMTAVVNFGAGRL